MKNELKPCPFCGSTNIELRKGLFWGGGIHCYECTADVVFDSVKLVADKNCDWKTALTDAWNKRGEE